MSFKAVEDNADAQIKRFSDLRSDGEAVIEAYYPELYLPEVGGLFSNTVGSHLIADLLTSPFVVVDLYGYKDESALIKHYGVDKGFLLQLREAKLIAIAAILEPQRYKHCEWMHDVLSDERTIFRSLRTPLFFRSKYPDIVDKGNDEARRAESIFARLSTSDTKRYIEASGYAASGYPDSRYKGENLTPSALASHLAWCWVRLNAILGSDISPGYTIEDVITRPDPNCDLFFRDFHIAVSPHSGGLGGSFKLKETQARRLFPEVAPRDRTLLDMTYLQAVNTALLDKVLHLDVDDLSSEGYWAHILRRGRRKEILRALKNAQTKREIMEKERRIRLRFARADYEIKTEEIEEFLKADNQYLEDVSLVTTLGYLFSGYTFGYLSSPEHLGYAGGLVGVLGAEIVKSKGKQVVEYALERLQVASFLKKKD
jgi:hypothetical protein